MTFKVKWAFIILFLLILSCEGLSKIDGEPSGPDTTPPTIVDTDPVGQAINVPVDIVVKIYFSDYMDQASTQNAFILSTGTNIVVGRF